MTTNGDAELCTALMGAWGPGAAGRQLKADAAPPEPSKKIEGVVDTVVDVAQTTMEPADCITAFKRAIETYPQQAKNRRVGDWHRPAVAVEIEVEKGRPADSLGAKIANSAAVLCEVRCFAWDRGPDREVMVEVMYGHMKGTVGYTFGMGGRNEAVSLLSLAMRPFRSSAEGSGEAPEDRNSTSDAPRSASDNFGYPPGQAW